MNKETVLYVFIGALIGAAVTFVSVNGPSTGMSHMDTMQQGTSTSHMEMSMSDMSAALRDKTGDDFDKAFIEMMIDHHQGAIDMANLIPTRAKHEELKRLGQDIVTAQTKEISDMRAWEKSWGYTK